MTGSVTFSTAIGGDGSTVTDDDNATTGLRDGGWRTRFVPCFTNQVSIANYVVTKANEAAASQTAAGSSATSASTSASTATTKASEASTSATNAATSASNASTSASTASTQASNASTSATNAASSATAAAGSASTATTQAGIATTQATNASASASTATTQASNASTSATNAASSATAAAASYDSFDDRYLGAKTSDPSVDNDGNALLTGAIYWNTASNVMKVWSGSAWVSYNPAISYLPLAGGTMTGAITFAAGQDFPSTGASIRPSLLLDFANSNVLDPRITFTRSSSATYFGSDGLMKTTPAGIPRFTNNPATGESLGLLIEEQRTNLLTYSEQFDNAAWVPFGGTVATNTVVSPNGTQDADTFTEASGSTDPRFPINYSFTAGTNYSLSVYAKVKAGSAQRYLTLVFNSGYAAISGANFDLAAGAVGTTSNATGTITPVGNGWYRCTTIPYTNATGAGSLRIRVSSVNTSANIDAPAAYTGDGTSGIYLWGAQLEAGAFPTSYIPTTTAQATRAADNAVMTGVNFSSWYRQDEGSFLVNFNKTTVDTGANNGLLSIDDASVNNNYWRIFVGGSIFSVSAVQSNNVSQAYLSIGAISNSTVNKLACSIKQNDFSKVLNANTPNVDTLGVLPIAVSQLSIGGSNGGAYGITSANGTISKISYYPKRLSNTELQAMTTL